MLNSKHTFNKYLTDNISLIWPTINLYLEPEIPQRDYPALVVQYSEIDKSKTLAMWEYEVQFDIVFNNNQTLQCDLVLLRLLRFLGLSNDKPGNIRRIEKFKFVDEDGTKLEIPELYQDDSTVRWTRLHDPQAIVDTTMPEIRHKTFSIRLHCKDNA